MTKDKAPPSSNWLSLRKQLNSEKKPSKGTEYHGHEQRSRKRQRFDESDKSFRLSITSEHPHAPPPPPSGESSKGHGSAHAGSKNGVSLAALQQMTLGHSEYSEAQKQPGRYLALDCEMVGVGIDGAESSLARVSLVNFYGYTIMDDFVQQKERVVDYRTQWSGVRDSDMVHAKPFEEVQKRVADLLQDRILVGHAVHNDLKALLLSHPRAQTRDTQIYAYKFGLVKTKRVALRNLVKQELDLTIQIGEHSSITDARATMAVYKLNKKEWEKGSRPLPHAAKPYIMPTATVSTLPHPITTASTKRKHIDIDFASDDDDSDSGSGSDSDAEPPHQPVPIKKPLSPKQKGKAKAQSEAKTLTSFPGGGRKGVSSGLSTVVRRAGDKSHLSSAKGGLGAAEGSGSDWWKQLPGGGGGGGGSKGSIKLGTKR